MASMSAANGRRGVIVLCRAQRLLLTLVLVMTAMTFMISSLQRIWQPKDLIPIMSHSSVQSNDGASLPPANEQQKHLLLCPSNIEDMLRSQRDDPDAIPWTRASFETVRHCPLINNPIFHNHPTSDSIDTRLLIYISHRLRNGPTRVGCDEEWLFLLEPATIDSQGPLSPDDLLPSITSKELDRIHMLLRPSNQHIPHAGMHPVAVSKPQPQLQPPHGLQALPMSIVAIRISALSKALLERILALQRGPPRRTDDDAVAIAMTEYEFMDGVLAVTDTLQAVP